MPTARNRVLSGMRPTGKLHLGNYLGALANWVRLQQDYDCFYFVANWHVLTTDATESGKAPAYTIEMAADWLGAGLDPERSTLFIQSLVPEHAELHLLFSMVTPVGWLERVPTYKEMVEQLGIVSPSYGLLGYPLLQSADILMYKARFVPVGADQVPHIELTREVARRFNNTWSPVFPEPEAKLTEIPKVPGTDGRKMSKSYDNAIYLSDTAAEVTAKIKPMVTDPARKRRTDPGNPDICPVFDLHRIFTPDADREVAATGCRTAGIGCLDCKGILLKHMMPPLAEKPPTLPPATEQVSIAAEALPTEVSSLLQKGGSLESGGRWAEALSFYDEALHEHPEDAALTGFTNLGFGYKHLLLSLPADEFILTINPTLELPIGDSSVSETHPRAGGSMLFQKGFGDLPESLGLLRPLAGILSRFRCWRLCCGSASRWRPSVSKHGTLFCLARD
jgi:tryptophanyl-tRNA synthetase